jgi:hypothetical protein
MKNGELKTALYSVYNEMLQRRRRRENSVGRCCRLDKEEEDDQSISQGLIPAKRMGDFPC